MTDAAFGYFTDLKKKLFVKNDHIYMIARYLCDRDPGCEQLMDAVLEYITKTNPIL